MKLPLVLNIPETATYAAVETVVIGWSEWAYPHRTNTETLVVEVNKCHETCLYTRYNTYRIRITSRLFFQWKNEPPNEKLFTEVNMKKRFTDR